MFLVSAVRNKTKFVFLKCKKKIRTLDRKNSAVIVICEFTILQSSYDTSNKKTILARVQDGIIITKFSVAVSFDTHTQKKVLIISSYQLLLFSDFLKHLTKPY